MGVHRGMNIVTNGLVSYWDSTNPKCYNTYNLLQYTEDFTNAIHIKNLVTITANAITSPTGTTNGTKLVETSATGQHYITTGFTSGMGAGYYTNSIYVKAAERTTVCFQNTDNVNGGVQLTCDLVTGIYRVAISGGGWSNWTGSARHVGDGWYLLSISGNKLGTTQIYSSLFINSFASYTGTAGSGVYIWGTQLTYGKRQLPYQSVPTTSPSNTTVKDLVSSNNGTLTNGALVNSSEGLYIFDGVDDIINYGDVLKLNSEITLSAWVNIKVNNTINNVVMGRWGSNQYSYKMTISNGKVVMDLSNDGTTDNYSMTSIVLSLNTWYHITCTYNPVGATTQTYINGILQPTTITGTIPSVLYSGVSSFRMGNDASAYFFNGSTALPKIYNRVLTAAEVWQNYQATKSRFI